MSILLPNYKEWTFKAPTDIWTGNADGDSGRLITTGLLGSLRWWFEVLVRGLGGSVCDPSDRERRCPDPEIKDANEAGHHCLVCELFGCTGWARKFRFDVLTEDGEVRMNRITRNTTFKIRLTKLRPIRQQEWALLDLTMCLISGYGAVGGKIVYKPSDEPDRQNLLHHKDFGLIQLLEEKTAVFGPELEQYVRDRKWRSVPEDDLSWASLSNFWSVQGRYLARQDARHSTFNKVLGRMESKDKAKLDPTDRIFEWLAGKQRISKKVFSFKNPSRTFGFVNPALINFNQMLEQIKQVWPDLKEEEFLKGDEILATLLSKEGD